MSTIRFIRSAEQRLQKPISAVTIITTRYVIVLTAFYLQVKKIQGVKLLRENKLNGDVAYRKNEASDPTLADMLRKSGGLYGLKISNEDLTAANVGSTIRQIQACVWMRKFFDLTGAVRSLLFESNFYYVY
jgi:hypothetical protein